MLFVCEKCGAIDDSARENNFTNVTYGFENYEDDYFNKHICCTECCPAKYKDGVWTLSGKWHDYFPKKYIWEINPEVINQLIKENKIYIKSLKNKTRK